MRLSQFLEPPLNDSRNTSTTAANDERVTVLGDGPGDLCPICRNQPLLAAATAGANLLYCSRCQGMLIPMDAFPSVVETLRTQTGERAFVPKFNQEEHRRHIDCPHCHHGMDIDFYAGPQPLVMESCEFCELSWLVPAEHARVDPTRSYEEQTTEATTAW